MQDVANAALPRFSDDGLVLRYLMQIGDALTIESRHVRMEPGQLLSRAGDPLCNLRHIRLLAQSPRWHYSLEVGWRLPGCQCRLGESP